MNFDADLLVSVLNIIAIDIFLGGDNAVVIALACRRLPSKSRNKAIFLGTGLAVILRILLTVIMVTLLKIPLLLFIGGILLLFIAYRLVTDTDDKVNVKAGDNLISAVKTIVFADLVMGLDNILGIAGAAHGNVLLVILGLIVSVPIIIWGSKIILIAMEHIPGLIYVGGAILAYTASEMITGEERFQSFFEVYPQLKLTITVIIVVGILVAGWIANHIQDNNARSHL